MVAAAAPKLAACASGDEGPPEQPVGVQ